MCARAVACDVQTVVSARAGSGLSRFVAQEPKLVADDILQLATADSQMLRAVFSPEHDQA